MNNEDVQALLEDTARHYEGQKDKLFSTIQQLKKRCTRLQNENKYLQKQNQRLIREKKKEKQHYKNGKRGTKFNG